VLFNEPKLLKSKLLHDATKDLSGFSALQRAEIAEMVYRPSQLPPPPGFSALQRAEIAEIEDVFRLANALAGFSALQRAEIAEILTR